MKIKCIETTKEIIIYEKIMQNEVFETFIEEAEYMVHLCVNINNETRVCALLLHEQYIKDNSKCWYFDNYFRKHFKII